MAAHCPRCRSPALTDAVAPPFSARHRSNQAGLSALRTFCATVTLSERNVAAASILLCLPHLGLLPATQRRSQQMHHTEPHHNDGTRLSLVRAADGRMVIQAS
eukprot:3743463-Prymnesium_polylepis.1